MKNIIISIVIFFATTLSAQEKLLLMGSSGWNKIALLDKESAQIVWYHTLEKNQECNAIAVTKEGHILYSYKFGAKLITLDHQVIWDYIAPKGAELFTTTPLKNGNFLLGYCGNPARLVEVDKRGKTLLEIPLQSGILNVHDQFRQAIKARNGNYLIPLMGKSAVIEIDKEGKELKRWQVKGNPFSVIEQENGNLLVSCGDAHLFLEIDRISGDIVHSVGNNEIASSGYKFNFVAQLVPSEKSIIVCNWNGHAPESERNEPALIELDENNNVIWVLKCNDEIKGISSMQYYPINRKIKKQLTKNRTN